MLTDLYIENIAVIEKSNIEFSQGLNILTGETGAGKSIVIDALGAVLGRRTSRELIRTGEQSAFVSAEFAGLGSNAADKLSQLGYPVGKDGLVISRELTVSGKNNCRVNGRPATVAVLREIGESLITIHGQHESYELMSSEVHIGYIDALGNNSELLSRYAYAYGTYRELERRLRLLDTDRRERERQADMLRYQIDELESAALVPGEYEQLNSRRAVLSNAQKLTQLMQSVCFVLEGDGDAVAGAAELTDDAAQSLSQAAGMAQELVPLCERIENCRYELHDILSEVRSTADSFEGDPGELDSISQRLDLIHSLSKKYGDTVDDMLAFLESARSALADIEQHETDSAQLQSDCSSALSDCSRLADELSHRRSETAKLFCTRVAEELRCLDMPRAVIEVFQTHCELCENGCDSIELLFSANAGEPPKSVNKVASGGELSRMMLAIKTVLSKHDPTDTLIFDEVDSGVSGSAAERIGIKLFMVSKSSQVLCVTHLPQIAAMADSHYIVTKSSQNDRTYTAVQKLSQDGRADELARMMGGVTVTGSAREYAKELLFNANTAKKMTERKAGEYYEKMVCCTTE